MKTLREHIKNRTFSNFYLLYGTEEYLKSLYRDKLVNALVSGTDSMNYTCFSGEKPDLSVVSDLGVTPPFLEDYRVIVFQSTGLLKGSNDLSERMKDFAESTICIFVESEVDKVRAAFKYIKEHGTVTELNGLDERDLVLFIGSEFKKMNLGISESTATYLLDQVGKDMNRLQNEIQKIGGYCLGRPSVEREDIDALCSPVIDGKIFKMLDAIMEKRTDQALQLYSDLLACHEKPMGILYSLTRAFSDFARVKELAERGMNTQEIAQKLSMAPFVATKYSRMRKGASITELIAAVEYGTVLEQKIKSGDLDETIAVEMYIVTGGRAS